MAAGSISKGLVFRIRDLLKDHDRNLIPSDSYIYERLSFYQSEMMMIHKSTSQEFQFTITGDDTEYDLDPRFLEMKSWRGGTTDDDILFYFDYSRRKLIVETANGATTLYIKAFIIPATHLVEGSDDPVSDDITLTFDPIIGLGQPAAIARRFNQLLADAVLSEHSTKQRPFTPLDMVYQRLEILANEIQGVN